LVENSLEPEMPLVVVMGDSISAGYPYTDNKPGDYPSDWASWTATFRALSGYRVINQAISATTTDNCLARFMTDVVALNPDYVIIEYGNDCTFGLNEFYRTENNLTAISDICKATGIKIIFVQPIIRSNMTAYGTPEQLAEYKIYMERMHSYEQSLGYPSLIGFYNPLDESYDTVNLSLLADGIHPNLEGYRMVGEWLTPQLKSIIGNTGTNQDEGTRDINYLIYGTQRW
jgi:lysophospholipase L1-like esterase